MSCPCPDCRAEYNCEGERAVEKIEAQVARLREALVATLDWANEFDDPKGTLVTDAARAALEETK